MKDWNKKRKEIEKAAGELNKELNDITQQIVSDISLSRDKVSTELKKLFTNPLKPLTNTFRKARIRKETGNPPGKSNDPVGDQINWIQILENINNVTELWIITADYDYFTEYDKKLFLNPLLYAEIKNINPKIEVYLFNKLSEALKDFSNKEQVKSLPPKEELEIIAREEPGLILNPQPSRTIVSKFYGGGYAIPIKCPNCGKENSLSNGGFLRSKYGGLTYQYVCANCGHLYDTGDFWE